MSYQGKALVWLHKLDEDDFEYTLFLQSGVFADDLAWLEDDVRENLSFYGAEPWASDLKKMQPGDWVRFTMKWGWVGGNSYCHYDGTWESYSEVYNTRVRTLARGHYKEFYRAKGAS